MGLIGYYLALDYKSVSNDISENNYSDVYDLEMIGSNYNKSDIKQPFYFYDSSTDVVAVSYKKYSNIKVPSDISLENGDTFTYTDNETNNNFTIKLEDNEKPGGNIIRKLNYNVFKKTPDNSSRYVNIHNIIYDASYDCKLNDNDNSYNYMYYSDYIDKPIMYNFENYDDNYGDVYDNSNINIVGAYINHHCHGLIFKKAYYRIRSINFTENNDLSLNNEYFNLQNKLLKKKVMIEVLVDIYENIDIIREINENRYIGLCIFRKEINKEDNIANLWEYCYDNLKILLKKYIEDSINNFKIFEYSDVSSNIIDM